MVPAFQFSNLLLAKLMAWATAVFLLCCALWTHFYLPQRYVLVLLGAILLVGILFNWQSKLKRVTSNVVPSILFIVSVLPLLWLLFEAWDRQFVSSWSAGPLLPYSDAAGYVSGAKSLLTFGQLNEYGGRRPVGTCLLASVLGLTNQNYQVTLIFLAVLSGLATFFAALETWLTAGLSAALLYVGLCYLAFFEFVPLFMTETAGYIFASIAFAFLLAGFRRRSFGRALFGFGLLMIGLMARAGALFAVPVLALYLIYFFSKSRRDAIRKGIIVMAVGGTIVVSSLLLSMKISPPSGAYQGTLAFTLYGIAAGGRGWDYAMIEHPEIYEIIGDGERCRYVYSLFWKRATADPATFFATLFDIFLFAMKNAAAIFYGQVKFVPPFIPAGLAAVALILLGPSAVRRKGPWAFLLPMAIGIVLSSPFLCDVGVRLFMATIPFHLALAAIALPLVFNHVRAIRGRASNSPAPEVQIAGDVVTENTSPIWTWGQSGFAILLLLMVSVFPLAASVAATPIFDRLRQAQAGSQIDVLFYFNPHSGLSIEGKTAIPGVLSASFRSIMISPQFAQQLNPQRHMVSDDYLYHALFLPDRADMAYILFDRLPDTRPGYLRVKIRLLQRDHDAALYRAESFSRFDR